MIGLCTVREGEKRPGGEMYLPQLLYKLLLFNKILR